MQQQITAVFENGILRPLQPVEGVADQSRVDITINSRDTPRATSAPGSGIASCIGTVSDESAAQMRRSIEETFSKVDPSDW